MPAQTLEDNDALLAEVLKEVRRIELLTRGLIKETLGGAYHSRFKGQGIEFDDFREYQPGDDVRFMDWNVTARMNEPYVRKYVEERELTVMLLVDISGSGDYGSVKDSKRQSAAKIAGCFAFSAAHNNDKVGLCLFSDRIEHYLPARKGGAHVRRIIRDILFTQPKSRLTDPTPALELALQRIPHRALVVMVSDFITPNNATWEKSLRSVATKHDLVAAQILDPRELELPDAGRVVIEDPESGEQYVLNTSSAGVRQIYADRLRTMHGELEQRFKKCGVERLAIRTDMDYAPVLISYFRGRRRRKR